jgi:tetratricopeptide (TPR) repeat protein
MLPAKVKGEEAREWISQERCERLLGLTDWNRVSTLEEVLSRCKQPPLSAQMGNVGRVQALETAIANLRRNISTTPVEQARQVYLEALKAAPEDFRLRENYAEFLEAVRDHPTALEQRREVCRRTPHYYFSHYSLGLTLKEQGQFPEALESLKRAAALNPRQGEVPLEIGRVEARLSQWDAALKSLANAALLMPDDPRPRLFRGEVLWKMNRPAEAMKSMREATRLGPAYWEAHYRLGEYLALRNDLPGAVSAFEQTIRLNPGYVRAHANLGVALAKLGRNREAVREFDKALELDPQNKQLQEFRRSAQGF